MQNKGQDRRARAAPEPTEKQPQRKDLANKKPFVLTVAQSPNRSGSDNRRPHADRGHKTTQEESAKHEFFLEWREKHKRDQQKRKHARRLGGRECVGNKCRTLLAQGSGDDAG